MTRRLLALAAVAMLHGLLGLALLLGTARRSPKPPAPTTLRVDLHAEMPRQRDAPPARATVRRVTAPAREASASTAADLAGAFAVVGAPVGHGAAAAPAMAAAPARAPLDLTLPAGSGGRGHGRAPTMLEQMRADPRANSPKPTQSERFAIALGAIECVLEERLPDGTIVRMNGRRVPMQTLYRGATGQTSAVMVCVKQE